jgi:hypothetical protein
LTCLIAPNIVAPKHKIAVYSGVPLTEVIHYGMYGCCLIFGNDNDFFPFHHSVGTAAMVLIVPYL